MKSMTKNTQNHAALDKIIKNAFPLEPYTEYIELTEGYFNVAYQVSFESGNSCILKIAPQKEANIMSYEKNIMFSEVTAMELVHEKTDIPVAKVLFYDDSCTLCNSPYFFMQKLEGNSLSSLGNKLPEEVKKQIRVDTGSLNKKINTITNHTFGYLGQPDLQEKNWYSVFCHMIQLAIEDAKAMSIDLKISLPQLKQYLKSSKPIFEEVTSPVWYTGIYGMGTFS